MKNSKSHSSPSFVGSKEKNIKKVQLSKPPKGVYQDIDLKKLPKFICFKASLLREKNNFKLITIFLTMLLAIQYFAYKIDTTELHTKLRTKEYILAPGVQDFTPASPQSVTDSYIRDATNEFLSLFGNVSYGNIDEQYQTLKRFMSDKQRIRFENDSSTWLSRVIKDRISQTLTVTRKQIETDKKGNYKLTAHVDLEYHSKQQYLGSRKQVIEMKLKLIPPQDFKRWYLQILSLSWIGSDQFQSRNKLSQ